MIPWFAGGHCDPWNHVESAMALDVAGRHDEAAWAYEWLAATPAPGRQLAQLLPARRHGRGAQARHQRVRLHRHRRVAPLALHRRTEDFVDDLWPTVERALDWVLAHAPPRRRRRCGPSRPNERPWDYALLTGTSQHPARAAVRCGGRPRRRRRAARLGARPPTRCATVDRRSTRARSSPRTAGRWTGTTRC